MKNSNRFKTILKTVAAVFTLAVVFAACSKDRVEYQPVAGLSIVNAFPTADSLDFIVDNTRANKYPLKYNSKIDYQNLYPGNRRLGIAKHKGDKLIASQNYPLASGVGYSIFVVDTVDTNPKKFLLLEDDLSAPAADKAKVRFVNLSKDAGALSLRVNGKETDLFTNKAFYEYTSFTAVDPGESITFNINENNTLKTTLSNVKIERGKIYTIYAKGISTATVDSLKLGAAIYTHK